MIRLLEERQFVVALEEPHRRVGRCVIEVHAEAVERRREARKIVLVSELHTRDVAGVGVLGPSEAEALVEAVIVGHVGFREAETVDGVVDALVERRDPRPEPR
jgi:hypothetical protein